MSNSPKTVYVRQDLITLYNPDLYVANAIIKHLKVLSFSDVAGFIVESIVPSKYGTGTTQVISIDGFAATQWPRSVDDARNMANDFIAGWNACKKQVGI